MTHLQHWDPKIAAVHPQQKKKFDKQCTSILCDSEMQSSV